MEQDIKYLLGESQHPAMSGNSVEYYNKRMPKEF
jgi:hypothetical protein